ncbi:oxygen-dependent coproporphyrinogen oxidase [Legionella taurinensis]|uniref:coproporphyrinogen oxidase n=1 Tax=Legionella taurinensis TaxID=70611 RepID=A0AB38N168_9GAMM|nr:oxygen-dependent coproporphyrinogen oxidase [Legionella taurinensis]MDX1838730.1 oxygen-dependent coproporphyrinogen oxidase [Legionella taurinensis]PUT38770.1 oxygen-dependent coproporphyrinogen oxidase [Legionella taurinensis]PUT40232.1 oxygen-dependent coproporphyrinogen oxidase [Legionella taurinensis]PUT42539.1 oxygen-dependent coproporphyrinogen oxidase [Legionella taurinensis]PUT45958.1 oxygen-dependent coproporphyrinogen oxidase [Legionella taurinensis]
MGNDRITNAKAYFLDLQRRVCAELSRFEPEQEFTKDAWTSGVGEGLTCVLEHGLVIEKGGANVSYVHSATLPPASLVHRKDLTGLPFSSTGISIVIHPQNPYAPTSHANLRLFYMERENKAPLWWFDGGFDLTPYYGFVEDCQLWHQKALEACEPFGKDCYLEFKERADEYFYIKHRREPRGIGGLFFDDLNRWDFDTTFAFVKRVGEKYLEAYLPIVAKRHTMEYGERERQFQLYRRGRYVEFNLVYDRGTLFGLQFGGRTESILMSLPPYVSWSYEYSVQKQSAEAELVDYYLKTRDWINL